jgi:hypothetical protein
MRRKNLAKVVNYRQSLGIMVERLPVKKRKKARTRKDKRVVWTIEPPDDLKELVERAMHATKSTRTEVVLQCVREVLPDVVRKMIAEREARAKSWESEGGKGKP